MVGLVMKKTQAPRDVRRQGRRRQQCRLVALVAECMPRLAEVEAVAACRPEGTVSQRCFFRIGRTVECPSYTAPHLPLRWVNHKSRFDRITEDSDEMATSVRNDESPKFYEGRWRSARPFSTRHHHLLSIGLHCALVACGWLCCGPYAGPQTP